MNASLPRAEPESPDADLDARILHVERRLMAREDRLRSGIARLGGEVRERFQPRKLLLPVGGGLLAVATLVALWRRPAPAPAPAPRAPRSTLPLMQLFGLAWPLLPLRWRERVSPTAATSFLTLGLPLIETLLRPRPGEPLQTVAEVDLARLAGRWFIVGELPAPQGDDRPRQPPELGLLPREDGRFDLLQRRIDEQGPRGSEALVEPIAGSQGSRLRIHQGPELLRWLPQAWAEHGVLHVDAGYDEALIGSAGRDSLWLLARQPALAEERRQALVQIARERGYAVDGLRFYA